MHLLVYWHASSTLSTSLASCSKGVSQPISLLPVPQLSRVSMLIWPYLATLMVGLFDQARLAALPEALVDYQKLGDPMWWPARCLHRSIIPLTWQPTCHPTPTPRAALRLTPVCAQLRKSSQLLGHFLTGFSVASQEQLRYLISLDRLALEVQVRNAPTAQKR